MSPDVLGPVPIGIRDRPVVVLKVLVGVHSVEAMPPIQPVVIAVAVGDDRAEI